MIWLVEPLALFAEETFKQIVTEFNCTIIKTASQIPQWVECSDADFLLIKLKYPEFVDVAFTVSELQEALEYLNNRPFSITAHNIEPLDMLAIRLRNKSYNEA